MSKRIYVAGPLTKGVLADNVNAATNAFIKLAKAGFAPFCPHWSVYSKKCVQFDPTDPSICTVLGDVKGHPDMAHADWLRIDLAWVEVADAVLRLPGDSVGADAECAHALERGIPVYFTIDAVLAYLPFKELAGAHS